MANTLGIPERTLAQISTAADTINVIGGVDGRLSAYQPIVCRVTDHESDDGGTGADADNMALFVSTRHGEPWKKDSGAREHVLHPVAGVAIAPIATGTNYTVIFPDYDYTTFE